MTPRTSPHVESPHTTLDHLATLTQSRISSGYLRIPCPAHGGTNSNLALWVNQGGIAARCHSAGCSYADIAKAIEDRYGISINPRRYHDNPTALGPRPTNARRTPGPLAPLSPHRPSPLNIPPGSGLPTAIWRPELPLPGPVRWIGAEHLRRARQRGRSSPWPTAIYGPRPELSCIHLVFVAGDGSPAMDRGLNKRTYAAVQDAVVVLGCPLLEQTTAPVEVAEGLADALALASRSPAPAVATLGTSGMNSAIIAEWLATSPATRVWADRDEAKAGRAPPGQRYGRELMRLVNDAGGNATALHTPSPHKDPAAAAASMGFNDPGPAWREYARTLSETTACPRWEIARQAIAICAEE